VWNVWNVWNVENFISQNPKPTNSNPRIHRLKGMVRNHRNFYICQTMCSKSHLAWRNGCYHIWKLYNINMFRFFCTLSLTAYPLAPVLVLQIPLWTGLESEATQSFSARTSLVNSCYADYRLPFSCEWELLCPLWFCESLSSIKKGLSFSRSTSNTQNLEDIWFIVLEFII